MSAQPLKLLILGNIPQRLPAFTDLVGQLRGLMRIEATAIVSSPIPEPHHAALKAADITVRAFDGEVTEQQSQPRRLTRQRSAMLAARTKLLAVSALEKSLVPRRVAALGAQYERAVEILQDVKPQIVIAGGDRHLGMELPFLKAAGDLGIPRVIPAVVVASDALELLFTRRGRFLYTRHWLSKRLFDDLKQRHPSQVFESCLYYPPIVTEALSRFGALPKNPWQMGTGLVDLYCVGTELARQRALAAGADPERVKTIGDVAFDIVFRGSEMRSELRARLGSKYRLAPQDRWIVCAVPQLAEQGTLSWSEHWRDIDLLVSAMADTGSRVLLSLHPKMHRPDYVKYAKGRVHLLEERLSEVLPAADLYVSTLSSTTDWAILSGVPTIMVNFWNLPCENYEGFSSVKITTAPEQFRRLLNSHHAAGTDFFQDWRTLGREQIFDGRTMARYVDTLKAMLGR